MKQLLLSLFCSASLFAASSPSFEKIQDRAQLEILNPTLSERKMAKIHLANGLEAYLVSDPGIEQSAAALAVEAGSWNDPYEYPGMAHFLEHMLFMGTGAYPKESEYMQYINDHGGRVNAYTASDRTVYMFSVNNEGFDGALDRFSHFFIDPLFLPSCIDRELLAVDQEHAKNIENDGWRQYMIFKETGNPQHPCAKFSTGNADTLRGIPQSAMKQWYKEHYSAQQMHLVVLSAKPLDELIELTVQDFSQVPSHAVAPESFPPNMTSEKQRGHTIYIKPVKDLKILSLVWELPPNIAADNEVQPGELISYILKNGGPNSLLSLLKKESLALNISVSEEQYGKKNKIFSIDIELTEKGLQQIDEVKTYCFQMLRRLKTTGIPRYIFDEVQRIAKIQYEYQSRKDAFEFVLENAHALVDENLETFPQKTLIPTQYDPQFISNYIDVLNPKNCIFFVIADPSLTGTLPTKKEKWMLAEYTVKPTEQKQLVSWEKVAINPQIGLPAPNLFIPKKLELVHKTISEDPIIPVLLEDSSDGKIFYSDDQKYLSPEIVYMFRLKTPLLDGTAKSKALSAIYLKALQDDLLPIVSAAETAGSNVMLKEENFAFSLAIHGYNDQSHYLTEEIFNHLKKVTFTKDKFHHYKQSIAAAYENASKELPLLQSFEVLNNLLFNNEPTYIEKLKALQQLTYSDFLEFTHHLFKKTYVEGFLYGNISKEEGEALWFSIKEKLKSESYPLDDHYKRRVLILNDKKGPYMLAYSTPMQGNAAVLMIEEGPYSFEKRASQQILSRVLKDSFFETLRTKQQTAYIAKAWEKEEEKQLLQYFAVQSSTHHPNELIARFELFLENFVKQFSKKLPKERFEKVRKMAIATLQMPPENLLLMGSRLFVLAFDYDGDFNLIQKRIDALQHLTYEQLTEDAENFLSRKNTRRIAVLMEGLTAKDKDFRYELSSKEAIQNLGTFVTKKDSEAEMLEAIR